MKDFKEKRRIELMRKREQEAVRKEARSTAKQKAAEVCAITIIIVILCIINPLPIY